MIRTGLLARTRARGALLPVVATASVRRWICQSGRNGVSKKFFTENDGGNLDFRDQRNREREDQSNRKETDQSNRKEKDQSNRKEKDQSNRKETDQSNRKEKDQQNRKEKDQVLENREKDQVLENREKDQSNCNDRKDQSLENRDRETQSLENREVTSAMSDISDSVYRDELQLALKEFVDKRPLFTNPIDDYKDHFDQNAMSDHFGQNPMSDHGEVHPPRKPASDFQDICRQGEELPPTQGSLIEFTDPLSSGVQFGLVLQGAESRFNNNYNKPVVLTMENQITKVDPMYISIHLRQVFDPDWISHLQILENRFDETFAQRLQALSVLEVFLKGCIELSPSLDHQLNIAFSQFSDTAHVCAVSLPQIIASFQLPLPSLRLFNSSYHGQCQLIMACHLSMCNNPSKWLVSSCYRPVGTNIIHHACSNGLPRGATYLTNSILNQESIRKLNSDYSTDESLTEYNGFVNDLYKQQQSKSRMAFEKLNSLFMFWHGQKYKHLVDVLKFAVIYPHPQIVNKLSKLEVFDRDQLTPSTIVEFLESLKLYNNPKNQLTDIYLSSNIFGYSRMGQLAVASPEELGVNESQHESRLMLASNEYSDKFKHLRGFKQYYQDHVIYGIPLGKDVSDKSMETSYVGVSLEKLSARRYKINLHIPDLVTRLSPSSNLLNYLMKKSHSWSSWTGLSNHQSISIYDNQMTQKFAFKDQNPHKKPDWYSVGDVYRSNPQRESARKSSHSNNTCLTLSFTINSFDTNPFSDVSNKVSISLDDIGSVTTKNVNWPDLQESLHGRSRRLFNFKLFSNAHTPSEIGQDKSIGLDDSDHHNLQYIYNLMMSHFKIRNLEGSNFSPAINIRANDSSNVMKRLNYANEGQENEKLVTTLEARSFKEQLQFGKSKFLVNELDMFASRMISAYCYDHDIPVLANTQDLQDDINDEVSDAEETMDASQSTGDSKSADEVLVSHNNFMLPEYHANSFYQTLLAKDSTGYLSLPAHLIGRNYLSRSKKQVLSGSASAPHVSLGLDKGYIKAFDIFNDIETYLNQYQLVSHLQLSHINARSSTNDKEFGRQVHYTNLKKFSYLRSYGYHNHGPLSRASLQAYLPQLASAGKLIDFLGIRHKRYWTLKMLEQRLLQRERESLDEMNSKTGIKYECIITNLGYELPHLNKRVYRGFCKDLNLEIDILGDISTNNNVGSTIDCDKVMLLNPVIGHCVLREAIRL